MITGPPVARSLRQIQKLKVKEVLHVIRDAICSHERLFKRAGIIHGHVSIDNIVIITNPRDGSLSGMLIDFDRAFRVDMNNQAISSYAHALADFNGFMALELIEGEGEVSNIFRHDVESFFWILLCIGVLDGRNEGDDKPIRKWYRGEYSDVWHFKLGELVVL
jgi:hypothetical protein